MANGCGDRLTGFAGGSDAEKSIENNERPIDFGTSFPDAAKLLCGERSEVKIRETFLEFDGPSDLGEMAGGDERVAAIVTFSKKHHTPARLRVELAHEAGGLAACDFHEVLRLGSGGEGDPLRFEHLGGGENHDIRRRTT